MTDRLSKADRSRNMARIRGTHTTPELAVRRGLHRAGFRFRLHSSELPGRPDLVLAKHRAAIFVHGCFWHRHPGCAYAYEPKTRVAFWTRKFSENVERDRRQISELRAVGWRVGVVWECALHPAPRSSTTLEELIRWLRSDLPRLEIPAALVITTRSNRSARFWAPT